MQLVILGNGAWGTALSISFAVRHRVTLWGRDPAQMARLAQERSNQRYLPGALFPPGLQLQADLPNALGAAQLIIVAVPVAALRHTLQAVRPHAPHVPILWACKGFERSSGFLPHQVVQEVLGTTRPCGALSGPSFAEEVAAGQPAALTLAAWQPTFARETAQHLHGQRLRIYSSTDVVGVEMAGALKNVIAIASGLCDGLSLGLNARAALITRGLAEMARLGVALGGRPETFMGLSGLGDLILTCTGALSRNYRVGLQLASGRPLEQIMQELGHVAEGVSSAGAALQLAQRHQVEMPITAAVQQVLSGCWRPEQAAEMLLARESRPE